MRLIGVVTAFIVILAMPMAAYAHFKAQKGYTWEGGDGKCVLQRSEISDGKNGGGFAKSTIWTDKRQSTVFGPIECGVGWNRPIKWLAAKNVLMKFKKSINRWAYCVRGSFNHNGQVANVLNKHSYYSVPCNKGRYTNWGTGYTWFNGKWRGGTINSTAHYLPAD